MVFVGVTSFVLDYGPELLGIEQFSRAIAHNDARTQAREAVGNGARIGQEFGSRVVGAAVGDQIEELSMPRS